MCRFRNIGLRERKRVNWYKEGVGRDRGRYKDRKFIQIRVLSDRVKRRGPGERERVRYN